MDWIHCNNCFWQPNAEENSDENDAPGVENRLLYLTSCGHTFCSLCRGEGMKNSTCQVCKSQCDMIKLVENINHEVKDFFSDSETMLSKIQKIIEFQASHRMKLTAYRIITEKKYKDAQTEIKRLTKIVEKMYEDLITVNKENKELKATIASYAENKKRPHASSSIFGPHFNSPEVRPSQTSHVSKKQMLRSVLITPHHASKHQTSSNHNNSGFNKYPATLLTPSPSTSCNTFSGNH